MGIELDGLEFYAHHGHFAQEQTVGARFRVDLRLEVDAGRAAESDQLTDAVDYVSVYACVREQMLAPAPAAHLLEHLAARIAGALWERFPTLLTIGLKISKPAPLIGGPAERVSVTLEERR